MIDNNINSLVLPALTDSRHIIRADEFGSRKSKKKFHLVLIVNHLNLSGKYIFQMLSHFEVSFCT